MLAATGFVVVVAMAMTAEGRIADHEPIKDHVAMALATSRRLVVDASTGIISTTEVGKTSFLDFVDGIGAFRSLVHSRVADLGDRPQEAGDNTTSMATAGSASFLLVADCVLGKVSKLEVFLAKAVSVIGTAITLVPQAVLAVDECQEKGGVLESACVGLAALKFLSQARSAVADVAGLVADGPAVSTGLLRGAVECAKAGAVPLRRAVADLLHVC